MDTYKVVVETHNVCADVHDADLFRDFVTDSLTRLVHVAHSHGYDLLSVYLIKATDCAPLEGDN